MKTELKIAAGFITIALILVATHLFYLSSLNTKIEFPEDDFLDEVSKKVALVVVAHDDDAISSAGTVAQLKDKGWDIHFVTFYGHNQGSITAIRKKEANAAARIHNYASIHLIDLTITKIDTVRERWMPIKYEKFSEYFNMDSIQYHLTQLIDKYDPSVIFTLDDVFGGYGNSEHVCVSRVLTTICKESKGIPSFSVKRIYQALYPSDMNERIIGGMRVFEAAKKVYGFDKSPNPHVHVDISSGAEEKMKVLHTYSSQHKNLKKFWPFYNWYPSSIYFGIFDKEFFRILDFT